MPTVVIWNVKRHGVYVDSRVELTANTSQCQEHCTRFLRWRRTTEKVPSHTYLLELLSYPQTCVLIDAVQFKVLMNTSLYFYISLCVCLLIYGLLIAYGMTIYPLVWGWLWIIKIYRILKKPVYGLFNVFIKHLLLIWHLIFPGGGDLCCEWTW
jgi:hypothetical protein